MVVPSKGFEKEIDVSGVLTGGSIQTPAKDQRSKRIRKHWRLGHMDAVRIAASAMSAA